MVVWLAGVRNREGADTIFFRVATIIVGYLFSLHERKWCLSTKQPLPEGFLLIALLTAQLIDLPLQPPHLPLQVL